MQFVFIYHLIKRILRAGKVFVLLIRRRDLVKQLPGGYLRDMAATNRWMQVQLVGVVCFFVYPLTLFFGDGGAAGSTRAVLLLIGIIAMTMNFIRLIIRR